MAKPRRGKNVKTPGWRGACPSCGRTGVKLLWTKSVEGADSSLKVCKKCGG